MKKNDKAYLSDRVQKYWNRFNRMDSARADWEAEWKYTDLQTEAKIRQTDKWDMLLNVPLEKVHLEIHASKFSWLVPFDIVWSEEDNDPAKVLPIYFATQHYMDAENFYLEKKAWVYDWGKYWTIQMFTWIRQDSYLRYEPKEIYDWLYSDDLKAVKRVETKYAPKNWSIYNVRWDDQAMNQRDYRKADDIILEEQITPEQAKERWRSLTDEMGMGDDIFKPYAISDPIYWISNNYPNQLLVSYYYNKISSDRDIVINKKHCLRSWKYFHNWELPVASAQLFTNNNAIYWDWIPKRVRAMKWYKKSILQDIATAAKLSAWVNIILPSNAKLTAEVNSWLNVWKTSDGSTPQPVQMQTKIADMVAVVNLIDDAINVDVWENARSPFVPQSDKVGIVEIMEEKQQSRDRTKEENINIFWDDVITRTARNVCKYAVNMVKTTEQVKMKLNWVDEEDVTVEYFPDLKIQVKDHVVEKKKSKDDKDILTFREDFGKYWYFSLDKSMTWWEFMARTITPSTKMTNAVQKASFKEWIEALDVVVRMFSDIGLKINPQEDLSWVTLKNVTKRRAQLYDMNLKEWPVTKKSEVENKIKDEQNIAQQLLNDWSLPTNPVHNETNTQLPVQDPYETTPMVGGISQ